MTPNEAARCRIEVEVLAKESEIILWEMEPGPNEPPDQSARPWFPTLIGFDVVELGIEDIGPAIQEHIIGATGLTISPRVAEAMTLAFGKADRPVRFKGMDLKTGDAAMAMLPLSELHGVALSTMRPLAERVEQARSRWGVARHDVVLTDGLEPIPGLAVLLRGASTSIGRETR